MTGFTVREYAAGITLLYTAITFVPCAFLGGLTAWAIATVLNAIAGVIFVVIMERHERANGH